MDQITDRLFIGNSHDGLHSRQQLKDAGITAVLNVAVDLTNAQLTHKDFACYHVGLADGPGNHPRIAEAAVETLSGLLEAGHSVLVHCHMGRSRSVCVAAAAMHRITGMSFDSAMELIKEKRPEVDPHAALVADFKQLVLRARTAPEPGA